MSSTPPPEIGQLVKVRNRHWLVQDVHPGALDPKDVPHRRVTLEAVDPGFEGDTLQVIWEREVHREVFDALELPEVREDGWDPLDRFEAFLLATRWSLASALDQLPLQAPFRGAIEPEDFQLEPVVRALSMPRVNLLIADFVGAGKTIEAGLVMQELIARQRARRILILCPASLQHQWAEEMAQKFALEFRIVDRAAMTRLRKEYGVHVNPWNSHPRLITSIDFLKRAEPLGTFRTSLQGGYRGVLRSWDLLVVDEAHNVAPAGRGTRARDSDRTIMMREILPHFEHRLFLTATPHNGFTESFTALLEMLDPLRFSRGPITDRKTFVRQRDAVMVRRAKDEIVDDLGRRRFPNREVEALDVSLNDREKELVEALDRYTAMRFERGSATTTSRLAVRFALTLLKKRLLSSPLAFRNSIDVHHSHLRPESPPDEESGKVVRELQRRLAEDQSDDEEKDRLEQEAMAESSAFFDATSEEYALVERMKALAARLSEKRDTKAAVLLDWMEGLLEPGKGWNRNRLLLFTEYRDTLDYLHDLFRSKGWEDRVLVLSGGMPLKDREAIKAAFLADPDEHPVRVLLATDAASEGLNLQHHCRHLVHYEIPWNPNRMEQRNGRIDRHGQPPGATVHCRHFVYRDHEDQKFLDVIVEKVATQRDDLGAVSDIIAEEVTRCILREKEAVQEDRERTQRLRADLRSEVRSDQERRQRVRERILALRTALRKAQETWRLTPAAMVQVVHEALRLSGRYGLLPAGDPLLGERGWILRDNPWPECAQALTDAKGRRLKLVFPEALDREDPLYRRRDVSLVHLDHPLMKRALGIFRSNLWSRELSAAQSLSRVSYKVVPDSAAGHIHLIAVSRLVAVNTAGHKVHEELVPAGGIIREGEIDWVPPERLEELLRAPGTCPGIERDLGLALRRFFPAHKRLLEGHIKAVARGRSREVRDLLREKGTHEAREIRGLIDERLKEVRALLDRAMETREARQLRLDLYPTEMQEQEDRDLRSYERRLEELGRARKRDPEETRERYHVKADAVRAFPVGLLYVLPASTKGIAARRSRKGPITHLRLYTLLGALERCLRGLVEGFHPGESWTAFLAETRLEKVRSVLKDKRCARPDTPLILCLCLSDIAEIILKSDDLKRTLGMEEETKKAIQKRLAALNGLRNIVMHLDELATNPEEIEKLERRHDDLLDLLNTAEAALARKAGP